MAQQLKAAVDAATAYLLFELFGSEAHRKTAIDVAHQCGVAAWPEGWAPLFFKDKPVLLASWQAGFDTEAARNRLTSAEE